MYKSLESDIFETTSGDKATFPPPHFVERITWLESALNSEQNYVSLFIKKCLSFYYPERKGKKFFFLT